MTYRIPFDFAFFVFSITLFIAFWNGTYFESGVANLLEMDHFHFCCYLLAIQELVCYLVSCKFFTFQVHAYITKIARMESWFDLEWLFLMIWTNCACLIVMVFVCICASFSLFDEATMQIAKLDHINSCLLIWQGHEGRFSVYVHASKDKPVHFSRYFINREIRSDKVCVLIAKIKFIIS